MLSKSEDNILISASQNEDQSESESGFQYEYQYQYNPTLDGISDLDTDSFYQHIAHRTSALIHHPKKDRYQINKQNLKPLLLQNDGMFTPIRYSNAMKGIQVIGFLFASSENKASRELMHKLKRVHAKWKEQGDPLEIIYVSQDEEIGTFKNGFNKYHGNWLAMQWDGDRLKQMMRDFKATYIPWLVFVDKNWDIITKHGMTYQNHTTRPLTLKNEVEAVLEGYWQQRYQSMYAMEHPERSIDIEYSNRSEYRLTERMVTKNENRQKMLEEGRALDMKRQKQNGDDDKDNSWGCVIS